MKILVTGANGRIGRYVLRELLASGHEVMGIDLHSSGESNSPFLCVDLTDPGDVFQALAVGPSEAVVHLGAWSTAGRVPDTRTYGDNVRGTFNLFQACADLRIKRVISASSAQVYGLSKTPPIYLPLDEAHPLRPANCYALSKMAGEQAADYFSTRWNLRILSFRFMGVRTPLELEVEMDIISKDPSNSGLLWTRTDARDAATACRLALEAEDPPAGAYNVTGSSITLPQTTSELVKQVFGDRTEIRGALPDHASPMSCTRAETAFGYQPRFPWSVTRRHPEDEIKP